MSSNVDELTTLTALLDLVSQAHELATDRDKSERLKQLFAELRSKAREERKRLSRDQMGKRFDRCLIGISEELNFLDRVSWKNVVGLDLKLIRIRGDIERTILEIKDRRRII